MSANAADRFFRIERLAVMHTADRARFAVDEDFDFFFFAFLLPLAPGAEAMAAYVTLATRPDKRVPAASMTIGCVVTPTSHRRR